MLLRRQKEKIIVGFILACLVFGIGLYKYNVPGLYFDSAIIEYLASIIVFPANRNMHITMQYSFLPLLGSIYHGTLAIYLQMLLLLITRGGSLFLIRFSHLIYIWIICFFIYLILKKTTNMTIAIVISILAASNTNIILVSRSQVDIMLPGVMCVIIALYIWKSSNVEKVEKWWKIGLLSGLAFYDYFSFLFLVPMWIIIVAREDIKIRNKVNKIKFLGTEKYVFGFTLGILPYVWGFSDSVLHYIFSETMCKIVLLLLIVISVIFTLIPLIVKKEKIAFIRKIYFLLIVIVGCACLIGSIFGFAYIKSAINRFSYINVLGNKVTLFQKMTTFWRLVYIASSGIWTSYNILDHKGMEEMWLGKGTIIITITFLTLLIIDKIIKFGKQHFNAKVVTINNVEFFEIFGFYICYYVFSLKMISRMTPQHVEVFEWLNFLLIGFGLNGIVKILSVLKENQKVYKATIVTVGIALFIVNIQGTRKFTKRLEEMGGGHGYFSTTMTEEAMDSKNTGYKYIFADSGFLPTFIYLSNNNIEYEIAYRNTGLFDVNEVSKSLVDDWLSKGNKICLLSWDKKNIEKIVEKFGKYNTSTIEECCSKDGAVAYYKCFIIGKF